ncbi:hypothetical protein ALNOE001_08940 [Candidatus Methanobinarius endosymbioticus]|uniref:N-acetyltransferase domain-containing protein n=1 Tax=Candidatus Methanobinarius endosymbioticus TaxID=2006182 RepID=A0A366MAX6_9EURY|nr:hypothetical protein ALNOE001_08940 [Candidatus Methanobinarius endosymbioticus]
MKIKLRTEEKKDYKPVEEITKEAFWNVHSPRCSEHLIIHKLSNRNEFVKELISLQLIMKKLLEILYM